MRARARAARLPPGRAAPLRSVISHPSAERVAKAQGEGAVEAKLLTKEIEPSAL